MSNQNVKDYYNELAAEYDDNRFNNSYGQYIDLQERDFLNKILKDISPKQCLDLGCGTGRLLDYADYGVDFSEEMLKVAQKKYPQKQLMLGDLTQIPLPNDYLDVIFSFHVVMHQDLETTQNFIKHAYEKLKVGGKLIFDFPSSKRRKQVKHQQKNWHAANQLTSQEIRDLTEENWNFVSSRGFLFFPIHRIPKKIRPLCLSLDNFLCQSALKEFSSYLVVVLEKK